MTTTSPSPIDTVTTPATRTPLLAALGIGTALVLTAVATFWDATGNDSADNDQASTYPIVIVIVAVTSALAYGLVVRSAARGVPGRRSLLTALVAFVSLAAFWSGIPVVLASASLACALVDKDQRGALSRQALTGAAVSAVTVVLAVAACVLG